eukprot:4989178-Amphidinium_carterae.1
MKLQRLCRAGAAVTLWVVVLAYPSFGGARHDQLQLRSLVAALDMRAAGECTSLQDVGRS